MSNVLVLNSGSSSLKFQILDPKAGAEVGPQVVGLVEQIGETKGHIVLKHEGEKYELTAEIPDHTVGLTLALELMETNGFGLSNIEIAAVGHRVVHGGTVFSGPQLVDDAALEKMRELIPLAPLHNPANIAGIEVAREMLPEVPHVAVFDTGFFQSMPAEAATYAINKDVADKYSVRRYGFHGTSHEFISQEVPALLGKPAAEVNQIVLHLGNGASASAVRGGKAIDTSMGMTPLAGLVMGTRSGDIDAGVVFHLSRQAGMSVDEIDTLLNHKSGVKGLCGFNDFRDLHAHREAGDAAAELAYRVYIHQLRHYIGAYMIELGRVDAITFTAGVGENDDYVRADALAELENFGIFIDPERNKVRGGARLISTDESPVKVFVVPTNEELAIARFALSLVV
ncbi:acetate kinase [Corynebacterium caspium]|uniref:acetate kinase n=1 Tax=Corynebacterium caspium TaxID=234828 RepID=UPI000379772B|nr:acetate kinase [Corynebacterium caspium]WKD58658.1 Acetate kinase [Corynebacterium caspium DSM 44850]